MWKTTVLYVAAILSLSVTPILGQEAHEMAKHPGDVVKYEITFDGPDASGYTVRAGTLALTTEASKDQKTFLTQVFNSAIAHTADGVYSISFRIPDGIATGKYALQVYGGGPQNENAHRYDNGKEFTTPLIDIENQRAFVVPHISVSEKK